jgi:hypothetical protein
MVTCTSRCRLAGSRVLLRARSGHASAPRELATEQIYGLPFDVSILQPTASREKVPIVECEPVLTIELLLVARARPPIDSGQVVGRDHANFTPSRTIGAALSEDFLLRPLA